MDKTKQRAYQIFGATSLASGLLTFLFGYFVSAPTVFLAVFYALVATIGMFFVLVFSFQFLLFVGVAFNWSKRERSDEDEPKAF